MSNYLVVISCMTRSKFRHARVSNKVCMKKPDSLYIRQYDVKPVQLNF